MLTISIPVGLQYGVNPAKIEAQGNTLQVPPNQTLALLSGEITLKGSIKIKTQGIFGTQFRNILNINSDITAPGASSQLSGNVEIKQPDIDPTSGLFEISVDVVDGSHLIVQGCPAYKGNSFIITGRGGLPSLPNSIGRSNLALGVDWVENRVLQQARETINHNNISRFPIHSYVKQNQIIEASSWQINQKGEVLLTAPKPITKLFSSTSDPSIKCY